MSKQSDFIVSTDFASLKNDAASATTTITVPSATVIPANGVYQNYIDLVIGTPGSVNRGIISSSKEGNEYYSCQVYNVSRVGAGGYAYNIFAFFVRTSPTNIRMVVIVPNPYNFTLTGATGVEIFSFKLNTFIAPFS